jgi:hypothetical protein
MPGRLKNAWRFAIDVSTNPLRIAHPEFQECASVLQESLRKTTDRVIEKPSN